MGAVGGRTAAPSRPSFFFPVVDLLLSVERLTDDSRDDGKQRSAGDGEGTTADYADVVIVLTVAAEGRMKGGTCVVWPAAGL